MLYKGLTFFHRGLLKVKLRCLRLRCCARFACGDWEDSVGLSDASDASRNVTGLFVYVCVCWLADVGLPLGQC